MCRINRNNCNEFHGAWPATKGAVQCKKKNKFHGARSDQCTLICRWQKLLWTQQMAWRLICSEVSHVAHPLRAEDEMKQLTTLP